MATKSDILTKLKLIEKLLSFPKDMEFTLIGAYGKWKVLTPYSNDNFTHLMTKKELYNTLDNYVKGLEDYKNRVKLKKRYKRFKK
jgi:hypothetical protein